MPMVSSPQYVIPSLAASWAIDQRCRIAESYVSSGMRADDWTDQAGAPEPKDAQVVNPRSTESGDELRGAPRHFG